MKYLFHPAIAVFCLLPTLLRAGTVTNVASDTTPGSLRSVIAAAVANETITFAPNRSGATIRLGGNRIVLSKNVTINASSLSGGIIFDGENLSRAFTLEINAAPSITMKGLTILNGRKTSGAAGSGSKGGGIYIGRGDLTMINCALRGNVSLDGGAIHYNDGSFTLTNCILSGNSGHTGGGIYIVGPDHREITKNYILNNCTLSGNSSDSDILTSGESG